MGSLLLSVVESPKISVSQILLVLGLLVPFVYVVYQRWLHPLAKYPGPFLASLTDVWQVFQFLSLRQPYNLTQLHEQYGPFVRYGPDKISVTTEDAIPLLYQKGGRHFVKTEFYDAYGAKTPNVFGMRDVALHAVRRRHMSHSFSISYVKDMEQHLDVNIAILRRKIESLAATGEVFNLKTLLHYYTIDVLGELAFSQSFGVQESGDASRVPPVAEHSLLAAATGSWPAMTKTLKAWLPLVPHKGLKALFEGRNKCAALAAQCVQRRIGEIRDAKDGAEQRKDILTNLILATHPDTGERLKQSDLEAEAFGFIIAGTHTTSATTSLLLYHLLHYPDVLRRVVDELDAKLEPLGPGQASYSVTVAETALPYLKLCIRENFRLTPVFTMPLARRVMAPEGVVIGGEHFARGTSVAVCNHAFHHNPDIWGPDHNVFSPARWDEPETASRARFLMHFGLGSRQCIGKTVAQTNIYKLASTLLSEFAFELADAGERAAVDRGEFHGKIPSMVSVGISDLEKPLMVTVKKRREPSPIAEPDPQIRSPKTPQSGATSLHGACPRDPMKVVAISSRNVFPASPEPATLYHTGYVQCHSPSPLSIARKYKDAMEPTTSRPLTKRSRVALACNTCRQTKSKCDSDRPRCERCARQNIECVYSQSSQDKRLERQERQRARLALIAAMPSTGETVSAAAAGPASAVASVSAGREILYDQRSPAQKSTPGYSEADSATTNTESAIDMLATGAFDNRPASDVGHFGLSSNVALFRSVTQALADLGSRTPASYQDGSSLSSQQYGTPLPSPQRPLPTAGHRTAGGALQTDHDGVLSPCPLVSVQWITRFFDSVGAVLPYVNESSLLREIDTIGGRSDGNSANDTSDNIGSRQRNYRSVQALLSIVFAHALSITDLESAEAYYYQSLRFLLADEQSVCHSSVETVQALLLLGSYQQNSQRAMASLTSHSLCVRTSYQLGLHSSSSYAGLGAVEKELRATLWFAVVNQDRILSTALGRPCLIPPQHVRAEILNVLVPTHQLPSGVLSPSCMSSLCYFRHLSSLHEIMGAAMDDVYASNVGLPSDLTPGDLVANTIKILTRLAQWHAAMSPFRILSDKDDVAAWPPSKFHDDRYLLILSIYYHKTVMLASGPVLMATLQRATESRASSDVLPIVDILQEASASVLKTDLLALRAFQRIVAGVLGQQSSFVRRNAVWWACNFAALTMCLHLFAFWVISIFSPAMSAMLGLAQDDAEALLLEGLGTLRAIGGTSVMSFKAHRCLSRYIQLTRAIAAAHRSMDRRPSTTALLPESAEPSDIFQDLQQIVGASINGGAHGRQHSAGDLHGNGFPASGFPEFAVPTLDDLLCQLGDNDFLTPGGMDMDTEGLRNVGAESFMFNTM